MSLIIRISGKHCSSLFAIILTGLLILPAFAEAAEKKVNKKPAAKQAAPSKSTKQAKAKKPTAKQVKAIAKVDEDSVRAAFDSFTQEWMTKLAEAEEFQRTQRIKITETSEGYSAEYEGYLPQRFIEVKKTEYTDTPFVGTLTYYQRTLRCTAKTKEQAIQGPFEQVGTSAVREIFRYTKGKWVY
jgi:hypothetical protein